MSEYVPSSLAQLVRERARGRCEYCRLPQSSQEAAFHIDHIKPRSAEGPTADSNLALACVTCSLQKAARTDARDRLSNQRVPLFHPRQDRWGDHDIRGDRRVAPLIRGAEIYCNDCHAHVTFEFGNRDFEITQ